MLNIYLIRHGEKNKHNQSLSPKGRKQVIALSSRFKYLLVDYIYSSDLKRCKETTQILSGCLDAPVVYTIALREVPHDVKNHPLKYPDKIGVIKRFLEDLLAQEGNFLLSTSGIVNRILIGYLLKIPLPKCNFLQHNTGVTQIKITPEKTVCLYVNDTRHLTERLRSEY